MAASDAGNNQDAHFVGILGTTGCGKSTELKKRLKKVPARKRRRVLCWSPKEAKDNYAGFFGPSAKVCRTVGDVLKVVRAAGKSGAFCVVFVPTLSRKADEAAFDVFCRIALAAEDCVVIAEELHTVTTAARAVDGWTKLCLMGRAYGVWVFGLSQRPASVDKSFMGSLSYCHCGRLAYPEDQKNMARTLGVRPEVVADLIGYQAIQRDFITGQVRRV